MIFTDDEQQHIEQVVTKFEGNAQELENALGALVIGKLYGHRVIRVMHAGPSYTKYQKILQLRFADWCPSETKISTRHQGYKIALKAKSFWNLIRGTEEAPEGYKDSKKEFA